MPKYSFNFWEEQKYTIIFEADNLDHAIELVEEAKDVSDLELLPEMRQVFKNGSEHWDTVGPLPE